MVKERFQIIIYTTNIPNLRANPMQEMVFGFHQNKKSKPSVQRLAFFSGNYAIAN